jgi:hypothetical protein
MSLPKLLLVAVWVTVADGVVVEDTEAVADAVTDAVALGVAVGLRVAVGVLVEDLVPDCDEVPVVDKVGDDVKDRDSDLEADGEPSCMPDESEELELSKSSALDETLSEDCEESAEYDD